MFKNPLFLEGRDEIGCDPNDFTDGSTREALNEQRGEAFGEDGVGVGFVDDMAVGVQVGSDPDLGDATLDLVVVGFEVGFERFEVFAIEKELFVFGLGFGDGLEKGGLRWVEGMWKTVTVTMMMTVEMMMEVSGRGFVRGRRRVGVLRKREGGILVVRNRKEDEEIELVAMVEEDSSSY
ncbi:hypothetical protein V8G54_009812 [Vigna mungo]|uniref:Uncharacterized protein n=1 Tax=Vigna mungo TaxID=3915 RepID=A0AAQ3NV84_VIGMU